MAKSNRTPLQVSPQFLEKLKDLQMKIRKATGNDPSLRELTDSLASSNVFNDVEKQILNNGKINLDVKVRFDRRFLK